MDRAHMLAILNAASDDSLKSALSTLGIDMAPDEYGELPGQSDNALQKWDSLDASVPSTERGPMYDKSSLFMQKPVVQRDQLGLQQPGDEEMMMSASGMV